MEETFSITVLFPPGRLPCCLLPSIPEIRRGGGRFRGRLGRGGRLHVADPQRDFGTIIQG